MKIKGEPIADINKRLKEHFGSTRDLQNFRIVWADDEFEMRETKFTDEGFELLFPEVRKLPKYAHYIRERFVLERLTVVPVFQRKELPTDVLSYEPVWCFEDMRTGVFMWPGWPLIKFIIDTINDNIAKAGLYTKYKHPLSGLTPEQIKEVDTERVKEIERFLFDGETPVGDALAHGYGVGFTTSKVLEENKNEQLRTDERPEQANNQGANQSDG